VALVSEADERFPVGPRGVQGKQGKQGERGERGLSRLQGRAIVVLFLIAALFGAFNLFWTSHSVNASAAATQHQAAVDQAKWCGLVVTLDQADAAAPKKPVKGTFTAALVAEIHDLRQNLGC
jgi:hypothetical protein